LIGLLGTISPAHAGLQGKGGLSAPVDNDDGLPDTVERQIGTDPSKADTDGDGLSDGVEVLQTHTNPLNADMDSVGKAVSASVEG